ELYRRVRRSSTGECDGALQESETELYRRERRSSTGESSGALQESE
ncbi:hypothetical protein LSAT2_012228, partial [Lamellibrachia satsuma]